MTTLTLNAIPIHVAPERVTYNSMRLKYQRLAEAAAANFSAKRGNLQERGRNP